MQQALLLRVDGELSIDPQGVPVDYRIKTQLPQKLHDSLVQHVRTWRFEPVLIGGKPVLARTQMRVTLAAQGTGDDYRVAVDNVTFPQTQGVTPDANGNAEPPTSISYGRILPIHYPHDALQYGLEADVLLNLKLSAQGRVEQAFVEQTALLDVRGRPDALKDAARMFERAALFDITWWRFNVALHVLDPKPENLTVRVPVHFSLPRIADTRPNPASWQQEVRTPKLRAPWLPPDPNQQSVGVADLAAGELAPAGSRFRLTAPVAGSLL